MSLAESLSPVAVWNERLRWLTLHYLAFGPLALAVVIAYDRVGIAGLVAFALPPVLTMFSVRLYLTRTREAVEQLREANTDLVDANDRLSAMAEQVRKTHRDTIAALSRSMEAKDLYTGGHTERVAAIAVALAEELGFAGDELDAIEIGALLHDIGKIGVPEPILHKPGPLDEDEWRVMKQHPVMSDSILSTVELHPFVRQAARWSHEQIDGRGYPDGLAGDEIPMPARIVFVADAFDALTTDRPYRKARSAEAAVAEIKQNSGTQFCPDVVAALERAAAENLADVFAGAGVHVEPAEGVARAQGKTGTMRYA
jgi:HD-GYP domain-containing protein (c-di-GMP phosphodiesterase class II)